MTNSVLPQYSFLCAACYPTVAGQDPTDHSYEPFSGPCDRCGKVDFTLVLWNKDFIRRYVNG